MTLRRIVATAGLTAAALAGPAASASALTLTSVLLTDRADQPTAGQVRVFAAPIEGGREVEVGAAAAGPDGFFVVDASPEAADDRFRRPDGIADFRAIATYPDGQVGTWKFSTRLTRGTLGVRSEDPGAATATELTAHALSRTPSITIAPSVRPLPQVVDHRNDTEAPHQSYCTTTPLGDWSYRSAPALVGELNQAYGKDGTTAEVLYGEGGSTTTEFSVAEDYGNGSFKLTGAVTRSSGGAQAFRTGPNRWSRKLYIGYSFRKRRVGLACSYAGIVKEWTEVEPYRWEGGASTRKQKGTLNRCYRNEQTGYEGRVNDFNRTSSAATRYDGGVSVFGVGLTTQTDYSQTMRTQHRFGGKRGSPHYVCGADGSPQGSPGPLRAGRIFSGGRPRN